MSGSVVDNKFGLFNRFDSELHARFGAFVFVLHIGIILVEQYAERFFVLSIDANNHFGIASDGVAQVSAIERSESKIHLFTEVEEETSHHLVGASAFEVNVGTRVTAVQATEHHLEEKIVGGRSRSVFKRSGSAEAATAANANFAVFLAVEVKQDVAFDHTLTESISAGKTGFLVDSEKSLNRTCNDAVVDKCSKACSHSDAVVGAESSAVSAHPFAIDDGFDWVVVEVVLHISIFFAHHVHVTLHHNARGVFATRSGGAEHSHIAGIVDFVSDVVIFSEVDEKLSDFTFFFRRARHSCDVVKDVPHKRWC